MSASLHFQTKTGFLCRGGCVGSRALRFARIAIRSRGFTLAEAWGAAHGALGAPPGARHAWLAAERVAMAYWSRQAPPGCPQPPEIRLVLARRE